MISAKLDAKQMAAAVKRIERWQGAPLRKRIGEGTKQAGAYMVPKIRAGITNSKPNTAAQGQAVKRSKPGTLKRSVRVKQSGIDAYVGPTAPHRFMYIRGTTSHDLGSSKGSVSKSGKLVGASDTTRKGRGGYLSLPAIKGRSNVRLAAGVTHPGATSHPVVDEATQRHYIGAVGVVNSILFGKG